MGDSPRIGGRLPVLSGLPAGVLAWLVGYVVTYLSTSRAVRESLLARLGELATGEDVTWQIVGWLFFNAHTVPTLVDVDVPVVGGTSSTNFIAESAAFSPALYIVPVALLLGAGFVVGRRRRSTAVQDAILAGLAVTGGYLPLSIAGLVVFEVTADRSVAGPDPLAAVAIAGVAYPLAVATVGGALGGRTG